jgi:hypothetical protein
MAQIVIAWRSYRASDLMAVSGLSGCAYGWYTPNQGLGYGAKQALALNSDCRTFLLCVKARDCFFWAVCWFIKAVALHSYRLQF